MNPRRIAYVLNIFPKVSETFIIAELAELRRRGIELRIFSLLPPRDNVQEEMVAESGLGEITSYDVSRFRDAVADFGPDLLHAHFAKEATATAMEISHAMRVPFTFTAHGYDIHRKPPSDFHERAAAARAVITVSEANARFIEQTFLVPKDHIHVIPCGVDLRRFQPSADSAPIDDGEELLILCVARHVAVKNLGLLLDACALLQDRGTPFKCVILGDGPKREELESKRSALGLQTKVVMPGAAGQAEVAGWWRRASLGVLTSENEGMPVCLMEAAACGVAVVATRVGGIPELVQDGVTGLLCNSGDAPGIATALERLLVDPHLRSEMRAAARSLAKEKFSVARQVDSLLALWSGLLERVPHGRES